MNGTMSDFKPQTFMEYVQLHERTWGDEDYPNRPDLIDILRAPVCVFWLHVEDGRRRYSVSVHKDMRDIEEYMTQILFRRNIKDATRRIARIFTNGKPTRIKGVKIIFETQGSTETHEALKVEAPKVDEDLTKQSAASASQESDVDTPRQSNSVFIGDFPDDDITSAPSEENAGTLFLDEADE